MSISLKIPNPPATPSGTRAPHYVSPGTKSVLIFITGANQVSLNVTPGSPGCTATPSGTVCQIDNIGAPVGDTEISVSAFDSPVPPPGSKVGNVLSAGTVMAHIVEGGQNLVQIALGGVPNKAQITSLNTTPVNGSAADLHFSMKLMDADGYTIVGSTPYSSNVIGIAQPGPVGVGILQTNPIGYASKFEFVVNGATTTGGMQITSPGDTYSIIYSGSGIVSATLQVQQNGSPVLATATITPKAATAPVQNVSQLESGATIFPFNGELWFTEPSKKAIGYVQNGVEHDIPLPSGNTPSALAGGPTFMYGTTLVFGTQQGTVGYLTSNGVQGEYALPTTSPVAGIMATTDVSYGTYQIAYTQPAAHKVGIALMFGGRFTEYMLPTNATPGYMDAGYFVDPGSNAIGHVDSTGWKEYPLPTAASDPVDVAGGTGTLWIAEGAAKRVAVFDTQSNAMTEFATDAPLTSIAGGSVITATDNAGNIEYFQADGTKTTTQTGSAGPATQIRNYAGDGFLYVCSTCAVNLQEFLF